MHTANSCKSYRRVTALTAPPGQIVLMLFEGALHALERAISGFSIPDPAEANMAIHNNLQRAQDIIYELDGALDMEKGGEFAGTMRRLYNYFVRRLAESNVKKTRGGVEEVIRHLTVLRDAWAAMLNNQIPQNQSSSEQLVSAAT